MKRLLILLLVLLAGCRMSPEQEQEKVESDVVRYIDARAGVVCWIYSSILGAGIDCLPIGQTLLGKE